MKKDFWLVMAFLAAFLLGACAMNIPSSEQAQTHAETAPPATAETIPTEAEMTEQEKAIAQCRAVLDAVQSGTNYQITMTRWYEGVWDRTQQITYCRSGDNRAMTVKSSSDDHDGEYLSWADGSKKVSIGSRVYYGYAEKGDPLVWEGPLSGETLDFDPWMYTFDWDTDEVTLQMIQKTEAGRSITFQVEGTYPNDRVLSEFYTITFYFDDDGNFIERELAATGKEQSFQITDQGMIPSGETVDDYILTRVDRVTVDSLDPEVCAAEIDAIYQEALAYLNKHQ